MRNSKRQQEQRLRRSSRFNEDDECSKNIDKIDEVIRSVEKGQKKRKLRKLSDGSSIEVEEESQEDEEQNFDYCWKCLQNNGSLLCCDSCYRSFHVGCINLKKPPAGVWSCPQCLQLEHSQCPYCNSTSRGEKVVCTKCNVYIHLDCLTKVIPIECVLRSPINRKYESNEKKLIFHCCMPCFEQYGVGQIISNLPNFNCYLTLLESSSYVHCHFFTAEQVQNVNVRKLKNYKEKYEREEGESIYIEEDIIEYLEPERIIGCKKGLCDLKRSYKDIYQEMESIIPENYGSKNNLKFYIKWSRLYYEESSWEDAYLILDLYRDEFKRFLKTQILQETYGTSDYDVMYKQFIKIPNGKIISKREKGQPQFIIGGSLHSFQIEGLKWLLESYQTNNNVILADEMGLGKTIQTISFLNCLQYQFQNSGPFLIIGPATILYNWLKEIKRWAETFNAIVYTGNQESRDIIRSREFFYANTKVCKFNALITSYDTAINDQSIIKKIKWECLIVDEAHRLKNNDSKFFKVCSQFTSKHIILLTGTPLQNNIYELINLIEFIAPNKAKLLKNKDSLSLLFNQDQGVQISEETKKNTLQELNQLLKPHILRRTKTDVKLRIPEMEEIIIKLCLTDTQKFLYKNVLVRNYDKLKVLDQKSKGTNKANLLNILMTLRLVCNHPYLFTYKREFPLDDLTEMINQSNKLKFLDRIIPKLIEMQHKMLIFSQFTMMLDLLQNYLSLKGWSNERLDGTTSIMDRQRIIDTFNNQSGKSKIFLLSTRAGGLGINLTSADTIIFTDSDFNPYRDLQAISRAHRMGQMNKVKVYRLVSKYTAEERIIEIATKKLLLEEIIINPINKFSKDDFQSIFKESTWELFNKNLEEKDQEFTDEQINTLLNLEGSENVNLKKNDINDYYLSGFKFTSLNFETVQQQDEGQQNKQELNKYWETFLDEEAKEIAEQQLNEFGKGKRVKKNNIPNYQEDYQFHSSNPSEYSPSNQNPVTGSDEQDEEENEENNVKKKKEPTERTQKVIEKEQSILRFFQQTVIDHAELAQHNNLNKQENKDLIIHGFTIYHRLEFLDFVLSFGMDFDNCDSFLNQLMKEKPSCFSGEVRPLNDEFKKYLREFYALLLNYEQFMDKQNVAFCGLNPKGVFKRIYALIQLKRKYTQAMKRPYTFVIKNDHYSVVKLQKNSDGQFILRNDIWTNYDDFQLSKLIAEKGFNQIEKVFEEGFFQFSDTSDQPIWYRIFNKIEQSPFQKVEEKEHQIKKYVVYWLEQRVMLLMRLLSENEKQSQL